MASAKKLFLILCYCAIILISILEPVVLLYILLKSSVWFAILPIGAIASDIYYLKSHNKNIKYYNCKALYKWILMNYRFYNDMFS